jgi:hypothetical protein
MRRILRWGPCFAAALLSSYSQAQDPKACNGDERLCSRRYDEVVQLTTHNSFNWGVDGVPYLLPDQPSSITAQLNDGVRAFMIDIHWYNGWNPLERGKIYVCHSYCNLGGERLSQVLGYYSAFLKKHPREVVTLILESYVGAPDVARAFEKAGLARYAYAHDPRDPWPRLGELIDRDQRLVVLSDMAEGGPPWYMPVWDHAVETAFSVWKPADFSCAYNRGRPENALFIFNHFVEVQFLQPDTSRLINDPKYLLKRAERCETEKSRIVNYVVVDAYRTGDPARAVRTLNGL